MDDSSTHHNSNRRQLLGYLLRPPIVFLLGYCIAVTLSSFANEAAQGWLDPITWGSLFAFVHLAQTLPPSRSDVYYRFGPKPPNNRQLAGVFAVSTALYSIIAIELPIFWHRSSAPMAFPKWLIILFALLAPIAISFGFYRRYKAYKEPSSG